ncbi:MAG: 4-hydroxy-tetrahydrodipicolinate reductase [Deltaproteobacteria bacterium]|nr:4-hydroxy-tetrahydrodipicolinate reductase [Deltaproteobacteria bacterium]
MKTVLKLVVIGAGGRMGGRILANARKDSQIKVVGAIEAQGSPFVGKEMEGIKISDDLKKVLAVSDAAIDFSHFEATVPNLKIAASLKKPLVIGTTGHTAAQREEIKKLAGQTAVVFSPNMSVMVNVMWKILGVAAGTLKGTEISIAETHHAGKKDKPSGTALEIRHVLGNPQIEIESKREGDVVGDHTVLFATPEESLEVTHRALSRDTFAVGALLAAKWAVGKKPGLYGMTDVLGL